MGHRQRPNLPTEQRNVPGQTSGPMHYGAGHREVHETRAGREFYESGGLHREWITSRRILEPDPRYFRPVEPPWPVRVFRRLVRWICQSALAAPGLALTFGAIWAAWTLGGAGAGVAAFVLVCLMLGWGL